MPGRKWLNGFLLRHPELMCGKTMLLSEQRVRVTETKLRDWFNEVRENLLADKIDITKVDPRCIFNADESGLPLYTQGQVVLTERSNKHPYHVGCRPASSADNNFSWQKVDASALGREDFPDSASALTKNGWINAETWLKWMNEMFIPAVEHLPRPLVLFVDGHTGHVGLEVHELCQKHKIVYYVLPSHASHIVQPLDLVFYRRLKREWRQACSDYKGIFRVGSIFPHNFTPVFRTVWETLQQGVSQKGIPSKRALSMEPGCTGL